MASSPRLGELQAAFRDALLDGRPAAAAAVVVGDGLPQGARLGIYGHHVVATLSAVLEAAYPVVRRLVDPRFFAFVADRYVRAHPPRGPCLFEYGASFPDFLAAFPPARDLVYLADVARLEWLLRAALHAADAQAMPGVRLRALAAADPAGLVLRLDPSLGYLASPWPIDRIWRANQGDEGQDQAPVRLDAGPAHLELRRLEDTATMRAIDPATLAFRRALGQARRLEEAAAAAFAVTPTFDLTRQLAALFEEALVVGLESTAGSRGSDGSAIA
jgi:hypothetical protein